MKKKLFSAIVLITIFITSCQNRNVGLVCSSIKSISKCCKVLKSANPTNVNQGGIEDETASSEKKEPSAPLPAYSWDRHMMIW